MGRAGQVKWIDYLASDIMVYTGDLERLKDKTGGQKDDSTHQVIGIIPVKTLLRPVEE